MKMADIFRGLGSQEYLHSFCLLSMDDCKYHSVWNLQVGWGSVGCARMLAVVLSTVPLMLSPCGGHCMKVRKGPSIMMCSDA